MMLDDARFKVVFVVDIRNWAFDRIAQRVSRELSDVFSCSILYWEDYSNTEEFINSINYTDPDIVHFFYREELRLILNSVPTVSPSFIRFLDRAITTHIPDHLFSDDVSIADRVALFSAIDGYFVTNKKLFDIYSRVDFIPKPHDVIYDWIDVDPVPLEHEKWYSNIRILWSGNSNWGGYVGHRDYKGLRSVIRPAIDLLNRKYRNVEFLCFDSAEKRISSHEVLEAMKNCHILVLAAENEGTPLSLIEAMASRCAVVSSKAGIVEEVLPSQQRKYLFDRTSGGLFEKLEELINDRSLLRRLGDLNHQAWEENFGMTSPLKGKWIHFIMNAIAHSKTASVETKMKFLPQRSKNLRHYGVNAIRKAGKIVNKCGLVDTLNKLSPRFGATYHTIVHGSGEKKLSPQVLSHIYKEKFAKISLENAIVIYAPMWKGVSASTEAIFGDAAIKFPFVDTEYPEVDKHYFLERMSFLLNETGDKPIIFSGGSKIHAALAVRIKSRQPNRRMYFMWHGSPAQWVDRKQLEFFGSWRDLYAQEVISGFIVLKKGLDVSLERIGVRAYYIFNPIPDLNGCVRYNHGFLNRVGVFSAVESWYKNPFPQLMSLANCDIEVTTNISEESIRKIGSNFWRYRIINHLDRVSFLDVLSKQDLNLYITNTECSPMIALESWELGVPCIVGPAGDVFSDVCQKLAHWLVEPNVDDAYSISRRISLVAANYEEIRQRMLEARAIQRQNFRVQREKLYEWVLGMSER
ncbi:glycosyltransferase [Ochrobactrum sp. BTU2]|uniref:glycosyltransferase n=1 Tax=Ochrobactrum sp. BTU2 TaxID=2856166 RepID=UPI00211A1271|nr:glycosyltransferase [Ochrobactrum sp. BTU2]MCQ9148405.1 glycosyltransferase [Ochrobactrum sp. BTU2]